MYGRYTQWIYINVSAYTNIYIYQSIYFYGQLCVDMTDEGQENLTATCTKWQDNILTNATMSWAMTTNLVVNEPAR